MQQSDTVSKRLELLREAVPALRGLATLANAGSPYSVLEMREVEATARALGLDPAALEIQRAEDIVTAIESFKGRMQALYVVPDSLVIDQRTRISSVALGERLPTMHGIREFVEAGGLMSYGPDMPVLWRRAGEYVDKILRGTKPGDIPVEQPTKFELVINLVTARVLGLTMPPPLLARADEVIE